MNDKSKLFSSRSGNTAYGLFLMFKNQKKMNFKTYAQKSQKWGSSIMLGKRKLKALNRC